MIKQKFRVYGVFFNQISNGLCTAQELPTRTIINVGDFVLFEEYSHNGGYTKRELLAKVTFVYHNRDTANGRQSFFCFRIIRSVEEIEAHEWKAGEHYSVEKANRIQCKALEGIHQACIDRLFRLHVKKQIEDLLPICSFDVKCKLNLLLTAFDRKWSIESNGKELNHG